MEKLSRHFRYVLIEAPAGGEQKHWITELLLRSDLGYLFFEGRGDRLPRAAQHLKQARAKRPGRTTHLKLIACLGENESPGDLEAQALRLATPVHLFVRGCTHDGLNGSTSNPESRNKWFATDVRRLARDISGRLVGLALSSGAAKGFAHIGVIQVLEENGLEVDVVAGSSMGAYVGSLWAQGNRGPELERLARQLEGRWPVWTLIDPVFPPRQGFVRGYAVKRRLMQTLGEARFGDLPMPLRVVATNLETLERVVFAGGEVAAAVHASIAVPGICVPITIDGETYIDGGIVDPLPVGVLREMGITRVIAVDVIPTPERIREALIAEQEVARRGRRRGIFRRKNPINQQFNYFAKGNLFEILMRSIQGAQIRVAQASGLLADVLVQPEIRDDRWLDYRNPGKFIKLGREAAERQLEEIKALVNRADAPPPGIPIPILEGRQFESDPEEQALAGLTTELEKGAGI
jgi:NTE family protein